MEIFGGFMVMMSILGFFLAIIWLIMPFVVLTIKGKLDKTLDLLDGINSRLGEMEKQLTALHNVRPVDNSGSQEAAVKAPAEGTSHTPPPLPLA